MARELQQTRDDTCIYRIDNVTLGSTGDVVLNVFKITGSVRIHDQYAIITRVGTLTNLTAMYATLYDGTNTVDLTADGAVLSGAPVGTIFLKDQVATETYTVAMADECRISEIGLEKRAGRPFTVTAKNGADTYIQFRYSTTDNPVDFDVELHFEYELMNGSSLELA